MTLLNGTIDLGNGILSELFPITVGVKQGGILSPDLFKNMIDELIFTLVNEDIGARINSTNVSTKVYADDIVLLSPVDSHLQRLLDICDEFSKNWRIRFNAKKSNIMEIGPQFFKNSNFFINNNLIPKVDEMIYLGVKINNKLSFQQVHHAHFGSKSSSIVVSHEKN
jgi:hypothetical protein